MAEAEKKRSPASAALIELRKAMGKTQQTFAVEVLQCAIGTIARYESNDPPRGDILMRLSGIAREQGLIELSNKFRYFFTQDVVKTIGAQLTIVPEEGSTQAHGYLTVKLSGELAVRLAQSVVTCLAQIDSPHPGEAKAGRAAVEALEAAVRKTKQGSAVGEIHDHFRSLTMRKKGSKK